ncbi:hypothetical protein L6270_02905 [Candidatus Parcubacteria bacterium]|nr:hypothetical protein [Patescibacteria group bacterium]MBU4308910.1 hypothetical protein [Patescibacteria group bacterium]MBU4432588.1 hypothetical protein [Patescibacteria group bacterium]MBU4577270.1 hypothetical protein [Patescibacteria group bacterium]MCG2696960.1 hypothetical protein [Candidatus Parcubacteria bacterium]
MTNDNKFDQELLDKIKSDKLAPTPKWHFLLKDYLVWAVGVLSLLIGGLAFSVIIYMLRFSDWNVYKQIGESFLSFILISLPYFWLALLAFFIFLVYYNIEHTKNGYRYSVPIVLLANVVISLFLGLLFFKAGVGQEFDRILGESMPFYPNLMNQNINFWMQPDAGRLTGIVISKDVENNFILLDFNQNQWNVDVSNVELGPMEMFMLGGPIRVFGVKASSSGNFVAQMILPVPPPGGGLYKRHRDIHFEANDRVFLMK